MSTNNQLNVTNVIAACSTMYKCRYLITWVHPKDKNCINWSKIKNILWEGRYLVPTGPPILGQHYNGFYRHVVILETFEDNDYVYCDRAQWEMLKLLQKLKIEENILVYGYTEADFVPIDFVKLEGYFNFNQYFVTSKMLCHPRVHCWPWGLNAEWGHSGDYINIYDYSNYLNNLNINNKNSNIFISGRVHEGENSIKLKYLKQAGLDTIAQMFNYDQKGNVIGTFFPWKEHLKKLANSYFSALPSTSQDSTSAGTGPQLWERWYVNNIPIMSPFLAFREWNKIFPSIIVNDWSEIDSKNLTKTRYEDIMAQYDGYEWRKYLDWNYFFKQQVTKVLEEGT